MPQFDADFYVAQCAVELAQALVANLRRQVVETGNEKDLERFTDTFGSVMQQPKPTEPPQPKHIAKRSTIADWLWAG